MPTAQQRLDALAKVDSIVIDGLHERLRIAEDHEWATLHALVKGELKIFGKPVALQWPEGRPFGLTDEQLAKMLGPVYGSSGGSPSTT